MKKMNLKKIAAFVLAATMAVGMSATVFADTTVEEGSGTTTTTKTYTDMSTVTINKTYRTANDDTTSPAETFYLKQEGNGVVSDGDATSAPALTKIKVNGEDSDYVASVSYSEGEAGTNTKTKSFSVSLPTYEKVGIYEYSLKEVAGTTAGVTYRTDAIKLVVTVIEQNGLVRVAGVHAEDADGDKTDTFDDNVYSAGSLEVSKTVKGILGDTKKYFNVKVTLTGETGKTYAESYNVTSSDATAQNPTTIKIGEETTFKLKSGDKISIANLPYGVTYTVEEEDYTSDGYEASYVWSDKDNKKIDSAEDTVAITNTKGTDDDVDTGLIMTYAPYIAMIAAACVLAVVFFNRKREDA